MNIQIGIAGYGNLGKGVETALRQAEDMTLAGVFTHRDPRFVRVFRDTPLYAWEELSEKAKDIDVLIACGGSARDLPKQTPQLAQYCHVVDSFDTHADMEAHFQRVNAACQKSGKLALIGAGWDPGLFSLLRVYMGAILPQGAISTFWGQGISQGHSDAIRQLKGVQDARQYTIPLSAKMEEARQGKPVEARTGHERECYVVCEPGVDLSALRRQILDMPHYFAGYATNVHFITSQELKQDHLSMAHGGHVIANGLLDEQQKRARMEFSMQTDSNPLYTGHILVSAARALYRLAQEGAIGCKTMLDIPPAYFSACPVRELRQKLL